MNKTVGLEALATNDTSNDCRLRLRVGELDILSKHPAPVISPSDALGCCAAQRSHKVGAFLSVLDAVEFLLLGVEVGDEGLQRTQNTLSLLRRLDLVKTLDDGEESGHTLALDTAQDQLTQLVNLNAGGKDDNNEIGHTGGIETGVKVSLDRDVL